jgi:CheY-like chemotaxis protein
MRTILFVDDDTATRELIGKILSRSGYNLILASGVDDALAHLAREPLPDLIISDVAMPGKDGLELLREVRQMTWGQRVSFIFLTARPSPGNLFQEPEAKADAFVSKPISVEALRELVRGFLPNGG